ncbi:type II toxin-antitoxin system Phd/YefM family antitoxin [Pseudorhodoferax sp.]|uniref:type II toxin-antitoxin system Phd/YefM family antitoxin n=1 Tax=Pseudorhodoferax sp. TaxID=1993553 RepID=UPI002DD68ACD|nr:type II toxin-antitoxin system Phd/YefM family antitoxin [Pseudorhodoferax sp.]
MQISATEGKNRFGYYLSQAEREPVEIVKNGRVAAVILSADRYAQLQSLEQHKSLEHRRRAFRAQFKDWIDEQNAHTEAHGVWCEGMVAWPQERG